MKRSALDRAIGIVDRLGIALVYPIDNKALPRSLWSELYPKVTMQWSWDEDADPRVADLWHLRERLARSHDVAYAKWFRGRATFFALPIFHAMLGRLAEAGDVFAGLPREALDILELLRERSPLSTKEIRALADLRGKEQEALFTRAMKALWSRLLVVGTGEIADGAFPSLAVGATELLFEDTWNARRHVPESVSTRLDEIFARTPAYEREFRRTLEEVGNSGRTGSLERAMTSARASGARTTKRPTKAPIRGARAKAERSTADAPFTEPSAVEVFTEDR